MSKYKASLLAFKASCWS